MRRAGLSRRPRPRPRSRARAPPGPAQVPHVVRPERARPLRGVRAAGRDDGPRARRLADLRTPRRAPPRHRQGGLPRDRGAARPRRRRPRPQARGVRSGRPRHGGAPQRGRAADGRGGHRAGGRRAVGRASGRARGVARAVRQAPPRPRAHRHAAQRRGQGLCHAGGPRDPRDRPAGHPRRRRRRAAQPRDRPRDRAGARVPGADQGHGDPGVARDGLRAVSRLYSVAPVKSFHVTTFGCQMNDHDSERMKGMLESLGYREVPERADADLILFNTCSIREKADDRFVAHLREAKALKRRDPERVIGVGGCWAQSVKEQVFRQFPFVDVAFGPGQVHKLAEFLTSDSLTAQGYFEFEGFTGHLPPKRARDVQAWMQISVGCNCRCAYCIVPSTRGREVSRPFGELVEEGRRLAADGVTEVTLLGQNVNAYGRDLRPDRATFAQLLGELDAIDGVRRIRYTSPHPKDMREDVIRAHAELASVCEHIHLPLQAGNSRILKAMRRTYTRERYMDRVALIREHVPDVALTTDIIVGFPGETETDFAETLEVVEEVGYDGAFTFIFSPRRGTEAADLDGQVPHPTKRERLGRP